MVEDLSELEWLSNNNELHTMFVQRYEELVNNGVSRRRKVVIEFASCCRSRNSLKDDFIPAEPTTDSEAK